MAPLPTQDQQVHQAPPLPNLGTPTDHPLIFPTIQDQGFTGLAQEPSDQGHHLDLIDLHQAPTDQVEDTLDMAIPTQDK